MNKIKIFNNSQFGDIRTATTETGEPLFSLADLCNALKLSNVTDVKKRIDSDDFDSIEDVDSIGRKANMIYVNESGMYTVILRSDSPFAKPMQKWVTSEVLPSIRKTGGYIQTTENDTPELIMARALIVAQSAIENFNEKIKAIELVVAQKDRRLELQQCVIRESAPKVQYYEEVLQSDKGIKTTIIAKELGMSAVMLNRRLKLAGVQYSVSGTWVLTAKYQNKGFAKTETFPFQHKDGTTGTDHLLVWLEKGRRFIHELSTSQKITA